MSSDQSTIPPWRRDIVFPLSPKCSSWGYRRGNKEDTNCDLEQLKIALRNDASQKIRLAWAPDSEYMVPPMVLHALHDACRERRLKFLARMAWVMVLGGVPMVALVVDQGMFNMSY
jgi:hypothetical protein